MTGVVLPHAVHGTGPRHVVALHGWLSDRHAFDALLPLLDGAAFTYVLPDVRGYGEAVGIAGEHTLDEVARDVVTLADELGWDTFGLVGHSMGGKAAQRVLADVPHRITALAGISPVPASDVPLDPAVAELFHNAEFTPAARRAIIDMGTGHRYHDVWLDRMVRHSVATSTPEAFASYLRSWSGTDFRDEVHGLATPMSVIVGAHDPDLSAEVMRATFLKWYRNCALEIIQDAGHYAIDETPILLAALLHGFFTSTR